MKERKRKEHRGMREALGFNFYDVFVLVFCITFGLICFYPLWYVLIASVTPYETFVEGGLMLFPKTHVKGMKLLNVLVVFNLFFSGGLIPQYVLYMNLGLIRNYWVMVLPGVLNITYFIIMRNYFSYSVPAELEEAARIDGCNDVRVFFRIIIPLSKPMLAAVSLFIAVIQWNDYYQYMVFIANKPQLQPFAWVLRRILTDQTMMSQVRNGAMSLGAQLPPPMALRMATIICAMLPIMVVYPFLQKYFAQGMLIGAVKE